MSAIPEETLMAYVDGELDEISRSRVERALSIDAELGAALEAQRRLKARLSGRYDPVLSDEVPQRLRSMLETNVVPLAAARRLERPSRSWWPQAAAIAATFVAGLVTAGALSDGGASGTSGEALAAKGELAEALDSKLAAETASQPTRIGVSFAAQDGRFCRTFETSQLAGLACRGDAKWDLVATARVTAPAGGEYRQAGSAAAVVMQTAQEMMAGQPLDAQAERRARDARWRNR
jgi:hypothetical protein